MPSGSTSTTCLSIDLCPAMPWGVTPTHGLAWSDRSRSRTGQRSGYSKSRFRLRNRILAALCRAVIVVEAAVTGGALITATKAMEYGITVFAVPGEVDRETSVWMQGRCW